MSNYKSNYTGAEIDSAVNKANSIPIIPQPTFENVGKVLSVVETGKDRYAYEFTLQQFTISFEQIMTGAIVCGLSYDQVRDLIWSGVSVDAYFLNRYRATEIYYDYRGDCIKFTFIYPSSDTELTIKVISYNADDTITFVDYVGAIHDA